MSVGGGSFVYSRIRVNRKCDLRSYVDRKSNGDSWLFLGYWGTCCDAEAFDRIEKCSSHCITGSAY